MKTIAVDLDNVLAGSAQRFIEFSNKTFSSHIGLEDYQEDWGTMWGVDHDEVIRRAEVIREQELQRSYEVIPGALDVLKRQKGKYNLIIITSRRKMVEQLTREWLDEHYPGIFEEIVFAGFWDDTTVRGGHLKHKGELYASTGANYVIDDQLKHCLAAAEAGVSALLFGDYPWNKQDSLPSGVTRALNWQEVQKYFDAEH